MVQSCSTFGANALAANTSALPAADLEAAAGYASAAGRGAWIFKMADHSRHRSIDTLRGYVRDGEIFRNHAGDGLL
jgi:hypothetical protein